MMPRQSAPPAPLLTGPMSQLPPRRKQWRRKSEPASRRTSGRSGKKPRPAGETKKVERIRNRTHPRFARTHVVARREIHGLHPAREAARLEQQLHVCRPAVTGYGRLVADCLQKLAEHRDSIKTIARERIGIAGVRKTCA